MCGSFLFGRSALRAAAGFLGLPWCIWGIASGAAGVLFGPLEGRNGDRFARFGGSACKMRARVLQDGDVMLVFEVICA